MKNESLKKTLFVIEDDPDQMAMMIAAVRDEIEQLQSDKNTTQSDMVKLQSLGIVKISNLETLRNALQKNLKPMLAIMDCNLPDTSDGAAHDQLVKVNHRITGAHNAIELIIAASPETPITMISSMNRFLSVVHRYYAKQSNLDVNFISKTEPKKIKRNITYYLRQYLKTANELAN